MNIFRNVFDTGIADRGDIANMLGNMFNDASSDRGENVDMFGNAFDMGIAAIS